jgi:hypothetical protein
MISYINPGASLTAVQWNAIFQAADAQMKTALGGFSAVLAGVDTHWDRPFFFFNPLTAPANLHPAAQSWLANFFGSNPFWVYLLFCRQYNDAPFASLLAGCTVASHSSTTGVAVLNHAPWATWLAAVYPNGLPTTNYTAYGVATIYTTGGGTIQTTIPLINCLDVSLQVWTVNIGGTSYAVSFKDQTTAEHVQLFKPVDVFVAGNFTWSSAWNKYSFVRLHNCSNGSISATFGGVTQTVGAGASFCARKLASGTWGGCGSYFHWMESGDPRFLQHLETSGGAAAPFAPGIVADVLAAVSPTNFGKTFNATQFWDASPVLNNASYTPGSAENPLPVLNGTKYGYFPALGTGDLLGDLAISKGNVMVALRGNGTSAVLPFTGFANLSNMLSGSGISQRPITVSGVANIELYAPFWDNSTEATVTLALIDLSSPFATFCTGGSTPVPAVAVGPSQTPGTGIGGVAIAPSVVLPLFWFNMWCIAPTSATTNYSYNERGDDDDGNPTETGSATVTVTNAGSTMTEASELLTVMTSVATAESLITNTVQNAAAGTGSVVTAGNFNLQSTVHGHILTWQETWPLNATFNGVGGATNGRVFILSVQANGLALIVTRGIYLNQTRYWNSSGTGNEWPYEFGIFPPTSPSTRFMQWNFPRTDHCYTFQQSNLVPFYSTNPISVDTVATPALVPETGISRPGQFSTTPDVWSVFNSWLNDLGTFESAGIEKNTSVFPGNSPLTDWMFQSIGSPAGLYNYQVVLAGAPFPGGLLPGSPYFGGAYGGEAFDGVTVEAENVLPCQAEHYNTLAGLLNAAPPSKWLPPDSPENTMLFTLNFAPANIIIVNPGVSYQAGDPIGMNLVVATVNATGGIVTVAQASGTTPTILSCNALACPLRPWTAADPSNPLLYPPLIGSPATFDTSVGDGSGLSFIPFFYPVAIPTPPGDGDEEQPNGGGSGTPWPETYWPRTAYFCWNGPSTNAAGTTGADPVGTYLGSLGMTVQATLPDGYGAPLAAEIVFTYDNYGTTTPASVIWAAYGFDSTFQTVAQTYRWVDIADARTLYARLNLPFILNQVAVPMRWSVQAGDYAQFTTPPISQVASSIMFAADFFEDTGGDYLRAYAYFDVNLCAATSPIAPLHYFDGSVTDGGIIPTGWFGDFVLNDDEIPPQSMVGVTALVYLLEGLQDTAVIALPQNYAYLDVAWCSANPALFDAGGDSGIPFIADNTVENNEAEVTILPGAGGAGGYDHAITSALANARVFTIPIDN